MNRLASRVVRLEEARLVVLPISHEDALAELDADPRPQPADAEFSDEELDAEWARLASL